MSISVQLKTCFSSSYESQEFDFGVIKQKLLCSHAASTDHDLTGQVVWPVSAFLSCYLVAHRDEITGKNIVELGSGAGLSGLVASQFACVLFCLLTSNFLHAFTKHYVLRPCVDPALL